VLLDVHLTRADLPQALACGDRALALHRFTGHRLGEARTALLLGHALQADAQADAARASWRTAETLFTDVGALEAADARALLG
jgi:hypothetical protein